MLRSLMKWIGLAVLALMGAGVLLAIDRSGRLLFRVVALLGTVMFLISIVTMLLTFRNARRLSPWALLLSAIISVMCTLVFFKLTGSPASQAATMVAALAGALVGVAWSLTNLLFVDEEAVRAKGTLWFLAVWALTLAIPQVVGLVGLRTPYVVAVLSFFGMGLAVGNALGLIFRYRGARRLAVSRERARA